MNTDQVKNSGHYIHRITYKYRERMVGFFILAGFIFLSTIIFISGKTQHLFEDYSTFYIDVASSDGISEGSVVNILGAEAGNVSKLTYTEDNKIRVSLKIYKDRHQLIKKNAKAIVNRLTNISTALIEIKSDSSDPSILANGSIIPVEETPSINDLVLGVARIIQSAGSKDLFEKLESIIPKAEKTMDNVELIISEIAAGHGTIGAAVFDKTVEAELKTVVNSGAAILTQAEGIFSIAKHRLIEIKPLLANATDATKDLPEIINNLKQTIILTNTALNSLNEELLLLPALTLDARKTLNRADNLLESAQNTWPLSNHYQKPTSLQLIPLQPVHD